MSNWQVSEKGEPSDRWELSVINMAALDAVQLAGSYAWQGTHKIIVWSCVGAAEYTAPPALAMMLRHTAAEYADQLNRAAGRTDRTEAQALDMYALRMKLCSALSEGVYRNGDGIPVNLPLTADTLQEFWDVVRGAGATALDSLDMLDLLMSIEEEFNVPISEKEIAAVIQDPEYADVENALRWLANKH